MAPRRRGAATRDGGTSAGAAAACTLASLPVLVALRILALLPLETRLLCRGVCRAWRTAASSRELYTRVDLRAAACCARGGDALLLTAAAAAGGGMTHLDVSGTARAVTHAALLRACAANAGALLEVHAGPRRTAEGYMIYDAVPDAEALLDAAGPQLRALHISLRVATRPEVGAALLHTQGVVKLCAVDVSVSDVAAAPDVIALLAHSTALHALVLRLRGAGTTALPALAEEAALCSSCFSLDYDFATPDVLPALTLLVRRGVAELRVRGNRLDPDSTSQVGMSRLWDFRVALTRSSCLTTLALNNCLRLETARTIHYILLALEAHASLRELDVSDNMDADGLMSILVKRMVLGRDSSALRVLTARACGLRDADLAWLPKLLADSRLERLDLRRNALTDAFFERVCAEARLGAGALRVLKAGNSAQARRAEAMVAAGAARAASGSGAA
jgi:hypothetical protein